MSEPPRYKKKKKTPDLKFVQPIPEKYAKEGRDGSTVLYRLPTPPPGTLEREDEPYTATFGPIEPGLQKRGYSQPTIQQRRYTTGVGQSMAGWPELPTSATGWSDTGAAQHNDHYRTSLEPYNDDSGLADTARMPAQSPLKIDYEHYKSLDSQIDKDLDAITEHRDTANTPEAQRRQAAVKKAKEAGEDPVNTEQYGGRPLESKSWHMEYQQLMNQASSRMKEYVTHPHRTK